MLYNLAYINTWNDVDKDKKILNVSMHEIGHSLGLAHSAPLNIMNYYIATTTELGGQDKKDYYCLWLGLICTAN